MNRLVRTTLVLEQYQCRKCSRFFYINKIDKSCLDLDFGCVYGCDDNGRHVMDIKTKIKEAEEIPQKKEEEDVTGTVVEKNNDHKITITLCDGDFEQSMGRKPKDQEEFDKWAELAEKGLMNGHIDWDIIYQCTKDAMPCEEESDKNESG
jgi:hypothetical protein